MSYIRCTSNPEGLYVWPDETHVNVWHNVQPPLSSDKPRSKEAHRFRVPIKTFEDALGKWVDEKRPDHLTLNRFTIRREHIFTKSGSKVNSDWWQEHWLKSRKRTEFLWRMSYRGHFVYMWETTLSYIAMNVKGRD